MRLLVLLLAGTLILGAAACGGGGGSSSSSSGTKPDEWASSVCGALQTWEDDLRAGSQQLSADIRASSDPKSVKEKLVTFLEKSEKSTEKLVDDVKAAGAPAVKDGEAIQRDLEASLTQARNTFDRAGTRAKKLQATPQALTTGLAASSPSRSRACSSRSMRSSSPRSRTITFSRPGTPAGPLPGARRHVGPVATMPGDGRRARLQAVRVLVRLGVLDPEREPRQPSLYRPIELVLVLLCRCFLHRGREGVA